VDEPARDPSIELQILTTEHFTLQGARSSATAESSSRVATYLSVLSAFVVALAFASGLIEDRGALWIYALLGLGVVFFLGLITYARVLENGIEDFLYVKEINRIRHFYTEVAPATARYFVLPTADDGRGIVRGMGISPGRWQRFLTNASTVFVINSLVGAVFAAVLMGRATGTDVVVIPVGVIVWGALVVAFYRHERRRWDGATGQHPALFPTP
jgi:hypothetical protein